MMDNKDQQNKAVLARISPKPPMALSQTLSAFQRQALAVAFAACALAVIVIVLYWVDRQGEWSLHEQQSKHRLELAGEIISRDISRVKSDLLFLASQIRLADDRGGIRTDETKRQFSDFLVSQKVYDQVRLISLQGDELVRVERTEDGTEFVDELALQNKFERYYVKDSLNLKPGEIFVSEFDLNQEHGQVELPVNPVIRFVTPVVNTHGETTCLLVFNYLGRSLLNELASISLPGRTYLVNNDGGFLLGATAESEWNWILEHDVDFEYQFQSDWNRLGDECFLGENGIFMAQKVALDPSNAKNKKDIWIVSHLTSNESFNTSHQTLTRLSLLAFLTMLPIWLLIRTWVVNLDSQHKQNQIIADSEKRLRVLSSKLVHLQEEERRAISRELHDQLGQQATAINLDLKLLKNKIQSQAVEQLDRVISESEHLLKTIHDFSKRVRPVVLDDLGLHEALESYIWEFESRNHIASRFNSNIQDREYPDDVSENVFRLVQESLTNVTRHAEAKNVWIDIEHDDRQGGPVLNLTVSDDGVGMNLSDNGEEKSQRLGILGMQERVDLLGGQVDFQQRGDRGTQIAIRIPVRANYYLVDQEKSNE